MCRFVGTEQSVAVVTDKRSRVQLRQSDIAGMAVDVIVLTVSTVTTVSSVSIVAMSVMSIDTVTVSTVSTVSIVAVYSVDVAVYMFYGRGQCGVVVIHAIVVVIVTVCSQRV